MASTPEQKNEGTIASRLRSSSKKTPETREGIKGKLSQSNKGISEIETGKIIKKSSNSKTKSLTSKISNTCCKEEKKDIMPTSSKQQANEKPIKHHHQPIHHIRWEGIEDTSTQWNCDLCRLDLSNNKEEQEPSNQYGDELQYYLLSSQAREDDLSGTVLPEVAVLPCNHVFHVSCLSALPLIHVTDPSCPVCDPVTTPLSFYKQ